MRCYFSSVAAVLIAISLSLSACASKPTQHTQDVNTPYREQQDAQDWANKFEQEEREVFHHKAAILSALDLKPGMTIADIGAGTGVFTIPMAQAVGSQGKVYAVDLMPHFLIYIQTQAQKANLSQVEAVQATSTSVKLPEASLDFAFMCESYHHMTEPKKYMESVFDALKPGAFLVVIDYHRRKGISDAWIWDHVRASREEVIQELEAVGFELIKEASILEKNYFLYLRKPVSMSLSKNYQN